MSGGLKGGDLVGWPPCDTISPVTAVVDTPHALATAALKGTYRSGWVSLG